MTQKDISTSSTIDSIPPGRSILSSLKAFISGWYRLALCIVLLLSLFLNFFHLGAAGYSNLYYAASVRSMLANWHNFFFVSFDPRGFVTIDKPPLGFWLQVVSAKIFGFNAWSILLPQALAGVLSVALLAHLVHRVYGELASLLAGLTLALMPISVVTNRTNDVDSLLVLTALCAAWAVIVATETGRLRWLLPGAVIVGLGFNIKMLEVYLVVPAFGLLYLFGAPLRLRTKILHLALATVMLLAVSLAWIIAVDLTPAIQRPYIGSSGYNSEMSLAFGYNGLTRIFGFTGLQSTFSLTPAQQTGVFSISDIGDPGPLRLFNYPLSSQVSWLLPLSIAGIIAVVWQKRPQLLRDRRQQGLLLWGVWFLTSTIFFSVAAFFHAYYMVMLAPSLCALVGIGVATMWQDYARLNWRGWLLPGAFVITALVQLHLLTPFPDWSRWLIPTISILTLLAIILLCVVRFLWQGRMQRIGPPLVALGVISFLIAPAIWATVPVLQNYNTAFPLAGPPPQTDAITKLLVQYDYALQHPDPALTNYLIAHQGKADYIVATTSANASSSIIVDTGKPVMALGGYAGLDHILTRDQIIRLVHQGKLRFFLFSDYYAFSNLPFELQQYFLELRAETTVPLPAGQQYTTTWVQTNCTLVMPRTWGRGIFGPGGMLTSNSVCCLYMIALEQVDLNGRLIRSLTNPARYYKVILVHLQMYPIFLYSLPSPCIVGLFPFL